MTTPLSKGLLVMSIGLSQLPSGAGGGGGGRGGGGGKGGGGLLGRYPEIVSRSATLSVMVAVESYSAQSPNVALVTGSVN